MAAPIIFLVLPHMDGDHTRLAAPCSDTSLHSSISSGRPAQSSFPPQRTAVSYISGLETDCWADAPPLPECVLGAELDERHVMPLVCFGPLKLGSHQIRSCDESRQGCGRNVWWRKVPLHTNTVLDSGASQPYPVLLTPAEACRCNLFPDYYKNKIKSIK